MIASFLFTCLQPWAVPRERRRARSHAERGSEEVVFHTKGSEMPEMTIRLQIDPATGKKNIVVSLRSDEDALPHEHEQQHRARWRSSSREVSSRPANWGRSSSNARRKHRLPPTRSTIHPLGKNVPSRKAAVHRQSTMTLIFPNLDTLRLALTAGGIPEAVSVAAARAAFDDNGQSWVEPSVALKPAAEKELHRLGIKTADSVHPVLDQTVDCWPQLLPLERVPLGRSDEKMPVLFQLAEQKQLPELVAEILRLGNDRQGFRWLAQGEGAQALLRVVGPPYYSLLRAIDGAGHNLAPIAYREAQPGVWVQLGYRHPLEEHIRPPSGKLLLMRRPRQWVYVDQAPFRDIYEVMDFAAPEPAMAWQDTDLGRRWTVPLRLIKGSTTEAAELWVLRESEAASQVDDFVQNADDQLLSRLAFAVGDVNGERAIVLRVRPSRQAAPVLVLGGVGFRPHLRLPNLFLPCGWRLHPPLRRRRRQTAGERSEQITGLYPGQDGVFRPETLPDAAFRPLHDWIDYVLDQNQQALTAWTQTARFDFESFICRDDEPAGKPEPQAPKKPKEKPEETVEAKPEARPAAEVKKARRKKKEDVTLDEAVSGAAERGGAFFAGPGEGVPRRCRPSGRAGAASPLAAAWLSSTACSGKPIPPPSAGAMPCGKRTKIPPTWPRAWYQAEVPRARLTSLGRRTGKGARPGDADAQADPRFGCGGHLGDA